jgi:hypothetical protein
LHGRQISEILSTGLGKSKSKRMQHPSDWLQSFEHFKAVAMFGNKLPSSLGRIFNAKHNMNIRMVSA